MKKKKIQNYQSKIKQSSDILQQLQSRVIVLQKQRDQKQQIIKQKTKTIQHFLQTISLYQQKCIQFQQETNIIKDQKIKTLKQKEDLLKQCQQWRQSYQESLKKNEFITELQIKIKNNQNTIQEYKKICNQLKANLQKQKIAFLTMQKSQGKQGELQKQIINLKNKLKQKQQKIIQYLSNQKNINNLNEAYTKLRKQKDDLFLKNQQKLKQIKLLTNLLNQQKYQITTLQEQVQQMKQNEFKNKQKKQNIDYLMKVNEELNSNILQRVSQIQRLQLKINSMESKINQKNTQSSKLRQLHEQKQQKISQLNMQIQNLRQRWVQQTNNRVSVQQKYLKSNQEALSQKYIISKLEQQKINIQKQLCNIQQQYQLQNLQIKKIVKNSQEQKQTYTKMLFNSQSSIQIMKTQINQLKNLHKQIQQRQIAHKNKSILFQSQIVTLKQNNCLLKNEKQMIINKCQQLKNIYDFVMKFKQQKLQ